MAHKPGTALRIDRQRVAEFCRRYQIVRLALFGSVLDQRFGPESDVDVLVEFKSGTRVGFLRLAGMEQELTEILSHKVDLRTPMELSRYFRQDVLDNAEVYYEQS